MNLIGILYRDIRVRILKIGNADVDLALSLCACFILFVTAPFCHEISATFEYICSNTYGRLGSSMKFVPGLGMQQILQSSRLLNSNRF